MISNKQILLTAAALGAMAVVAGALLSHQLKQRMPDSASEIYEVAVRYQFYHVFALLATGLLSEKFHSKWIQRAGISFIIGIFFFSGSLYIISGLIANGAPVPVLLGICTPLGGVGLISGWLFLVAGILKGGFS
jgi:uncharacterized membrane protein YgdD (TMEM256/DUF423 family)